MTNHRHRGVTMPGKLRAFIAICLIWAASCFLFGAYLRFQPVMLNQPDGSKLDLYASGDEFYNWLHDKNGYTVKQNDAGWYVYLDKKNTDELVFTPYVVGRDNPSTMGLIPWTNISSERMGEIRKQAVTRLRLSDSGRAPSTGTLNNLSIFIRFSDQSEYTQNISTYSSMFNGTTGNTMQSYFLEASYNALNIQTAFFPTPATTVVSWQDSHPRGYYSPYSSSNPIGYNGDTERTNREFTLLVNAVNGVRSQIPTSLNLDGDSDGLVDNVCFIIQGGTDGWAELLWPHRWSIYDRFVYINGKRVYDFNFQLSTYLVASSGVGVLCHEMFHSLGAPDLYHYDHDGLSPVGPWDLMENNSNPPQHMSAYMKYKYGHWIASIPELTTNGTYTLNPLTSATNNCYRIPSPNSSSEFFVVEYRRDMGTFESSLPGSGMLVYRINPNYEGNADGPPDEVYLYRPGGTSTVNGTINSANYSQETGRTAINSTTNPTPFLTNGSASGLNINSIGSAGATISFVLGNPIPGQPNCQITGPTDGSGFAVNSTVTVNVTATDTNGTISNVKFYIDDVLKYTDSAAPYTWNWSTTGYAAGSHAIKAIATDNSSNTATSVVNVVLLAPADEGFETGDFSAFAWDNSSTVPWTVQTAEKFSGTYAAKSGTIGNSASTTLSLPMPVTASGNISFYYKVSSESGYDVLKFYIDGVQQGSWSGTDGWAVATYPVSTGSRTFTWTYSKDVSVSSGSDCAWLDHIIFPPHAAYFAPPQNLIAAAGYGTVGLSWQAPASGTPSSYKVFRNSTLLATTGATSYTDNAVVNDTQYTYYVTAVYSSPAGESDASNTVMATPGTIIVSDFVIGSGASATDTNTPSPINVFYESLHGQSVYTAAELIAAGVTGPCDITKLGFNITGLPTLAMPNFVIRMGHTSATNAANWITTGLTTVWTTASYQPTTTGWNQVTLSSPFAWDGISNIVVDTAFGIIGSWNSSGTVQYTTATDGYRFARNDNADQTNLFTGGSTSTNRPNIKITTSYALPTPAIEVNPISLAFGRVRINTTTTNTFQISNPGSATLSGTITTPTGYSVASGRDAGSDEFVLRTAKKDGNIRNSLGYSIPAGGSRTFTVTFAPTAVQAYNGNITITHNAGGANKTVALTGQGGKSTIGLNAMSFTATLAPGASSNQTLTVSNSGNLSLNYSLTENGTVPWLTLNGGSSVSNTIAAGGNAQNITISFNATGLAPGTYNASISGTSNDPNQPTFSIPVTMNLYDPNTAPQINLPDQFAIAMNGELTVDFSAYVSDADNDELWLTYVESAHVTVGLNGLMVTFTPSVGWTGTEELSFTVHDGTTEATDVVQVVVSQVISSLDTPVLTIIRNAGATRLQWEAIDNASEYWIFRANAPYGAYSQIGSTSNLQFTDDTVLPKAFYQVKAVYIPVSK